MCTAVMWRSDNSYFGRNLDLEYNYPVTVTVTPRNFQLSFRHEHPLKQHYALIGMALVLDGYPLYFDAANEFGLCAAGLNFPGNAVYRAVREYRDNIASFELIPWLLGQCRDVEEAGEMLKRVSVSDSAFSQNIQPTPLHWMLSDPQRSLVVEAVSAGTCVYGNPVGVLTNNPPFPQQLTFLNRYMTLSPVQPDNLFVPDAVLEYTGSGMGSNGLPGGLSSEERFVRAVFARTNSKPEPSEESSVSQYFHIMKMVEQPKGCNILTDGSSEITQYTSCCNMNKGIYYYTTYENSRISGVDMRRENLDGSELVSFALNECGSILMQN